MKRVTQKTVADALGLSPSTVGLVLGSCLTRETKKISPETAERIRSKALQLGYQPHRAAQLVRSGRSNQIGLIHFGGHSEVGSAANRALAQSIAEHGYQYLAVDLSWNGNNVEEALKELIQARVEGAVISLITEAFRKEHAQMLTKAGIPVISVNGDPRMEIPLVCDDVEDSFFRLTRHALEMGHRKLLLVVHDSLNRPTLGRMSGFRLGMKGVGPVEVLTEDALYERRPFTHPATDGPFGVIVQLKMIEKQSAFQRSVYQLSRRLFLEKDLPDSILATSDVAAFGIFAAAHECGLRIPGDVALSGYGNNAFGQYPAYSLTTVDPRVAHSSGVAVDQLVAHIRNELPEIESRVFPAEILFRRSSRSRSELPFDPQIETPLFS